MSSRKRSKNRASSKSKSEASNAYGPAEDEVKKGGFFPMLIGMTVSLMLIFWIVSLFSPKPDRKDAASGNRGIDASTMLLESTSFEQFLRDANPDQILAKLNAIKQSGSPKLSPARVEENRRRIELSQKLLKLDTPPEYKKYAKLDWLQAQKSNFGIDFVGKMNSPHVAEKFEKCYSQFLNDTDQEVYREAHLARVSHVLFECIKGNRSADEVTKYLNDVLEKFPDDEVVSSTIRLQFSAAIESDIDIAKQLAEDVLRSDSVNDERAAGFMQFILDSYEVIKLNYDQLFMNRYVNGDVGLRELEKASLQLLSNPASGTLVVEKVSSVAQWFERRRLFEIAARIYQAMVDAHQQDREVEKTKALLDSIGNAGIKRMELVDQKILISASTLAGKQVGPKDFENRVVLGIFFTPNQPNSTRLLRFLERSAGRYAKFGSPIRVIAVPSNDDDFEAGLTARFSSSRIHFLGWQDGQPPELASVYPVTEFPHLMALDHQGKLVRVNMDPDRYELEIETLVDQR